MRKQLGLSQTEAAKRLIEYGANEIARKKRVSDWQVVIDQIKSPLIYVLIGAMAITGGILKDIEDTIMIGMAVVFNTVLGFFQERKANRSLEALAAVLSPKAKVKRDEVWQEVEAKTVVVGDVVRLELGVKISADGEVIKANTLSCDEAVLTGEVAALGKESKDKVFMGTIVASGTGEMVVTGIGGATELGKIASSLEETKEPATPLQQQLHQLAKVLTWIVVIVSLLVVGVGLATGLGLKEIFPIAVALAVASIPEGLAVALTVILAVGMQRILKRKALVRRLVAAETLGGVTVICVDKTGTLTEGKMTVIRALTVDEALLRKAAVLCNDLRDPLEIAMNDWGKEKFSGENAVRLDEIPFDPNYRYIATLYPKLLLVSGAPEEILAKCRMMDARHKLWIKKFEAEAKKGHRLVGFAYEQVKSKKMKIERDDMKELEWLGALVYEDPVRQGVEEVLLQAKRAGIKVKVITGDYLFTAKAVMSKLGIAGKSLEGKELERMDEEELAKAIEEVVLFARIKPEQKLKIVEALQKKGEVVAMTGDGVNDAPAIKKADIGIVVNEASDVSKETADMVLLDNNFATILEAVVEGRLIRDNLKKVMLYLLADSFGEIAIVVMSLLAGVPLAVTAGMILWINLVSDGFPNLALTMEPAEADLLLRKVDRRKNWLIDKQLLLLIGLISLVSAGTAFAAFLYYWHHPAYGLDHARSVAFALLGLNTLVYVWSARNLHLPLWRVRWNQNKWLIAAVMAGLGLQLTGLYSGFGQRLLGTVAIDWNEWLVIGLGSLLMIVIVEGVKWAHNRPSMRRVNL